MEPRFEVCENEVVYLGEKGQRLAWLTFPEVAPGVVEIDHTMVDPSLRGQGIAGGLIRRAVDALRERGLHARATCSYAVNWFEKHPEEGDLLE